MTGSDPRQTDFRVGDWVVRPQLGRVERGGVTAHLTPRAMAVLVHLAAAKGAVVSRNELLDAVWPRMAVSQDALSQCIVELRRAFGDDAKQPRVIETIPRVGVRLMQPIMPCETPLEAVPQKAAPRAPSAAPQAKHWGRIAAAALSVAAAVTGAVWLLLDADGPVAVGTESAAARSTEARDFYSSGEDYLRRVDRLDALKYEEEQYRRAVNEDPTFALAWAKLSRTHAAFHWYGIDRTPGRCALAEQAIRRALELDPGLPEAHLYLANYEHRCHDDYARALAEFAIAEQSIPNNAELHFLRSSVYRRLGDWRQALANGARAIELDGRNPVYQRQQHVTHLFLRDYANAEQLLDRLRMLNPDEGTIYVDRVVLALARDGDTDLARRYDAAPPTANYTSAMGYTYTRWLAALFDRDYDRALDVLAAADTVLDGDLRDARVSKTLLAARTHALAGQHAEARPAFATVVSDATAQLDAQLEDDPLVRQALTLALAEAQIGVGETERARAIARAAWETWPKTPRGALSTSALRLAYVTRVLVPLGDLDEALVELDAYLSEPGIWSIEGLLRDPRLEPLRIDPRFETLVAKYRR